MFKFCTIFLLYANYSSDFLCTIAENNNVENENFRHVSVNFQSSALRHTN